MITSSALLDAGHNASAHKAHIATQRSRTRATRAQDGKQDNAVDVYTMALLCDDEKLDDSYLVDDYCEHLVGRFERPEAPWSSLFK